MRSIKDSELVDLTEPSPTIEAVAPNSEDTENPLEDPSCILKIEVAITFSAVIVKFMAKKTDNPVIKAMNTLWTTDKTSTLQGLLHFTSRRLIVHFSFSSCDQLLMKLAVYNKFIFKKLN